MTYLTELAPLVPSYQYARRFRYRTTLIRAASGKVEANGHWAYPLYTFSIPLRNRRQSEIEEIMQYYHAAAGMENTFPFLDKGEDRSCAISQEISQDDQTLGTATASQTDFQLVKNYTAGGRTQQRKITRPIESGLLVEKDSVLQTITTQYTIEAGGIIRFVTPMTGGEVIKAGFKFYVPVRFSNEDLDQTIHDYSAGYISDVQVILEEDKE